MSAPRKYVYVVLTISQLELSLAAVRTHIARLQGLRLDALKTDTAKALEIVISRSRQVFDLMLQALALRRSRTKLVFTTAQFDVLCQANHLAKQRLQARLRAGDQSSAKQSLLDHFEDLETALAEANHDPTLFDISGADAFNNSELGMRVGSLKAAGPG